jgi:hypothetical protein
VFIEVSGLEENAEDVMSHKQHVRRNNNVDKDNKSFQKGGRIKIFWNELKIIKISFISKFRTD